MVQDLNFPLEIVSCPTIREDDGLAQSSRNIYLSDEQRLIAPILYQSLNAMKFAFNHGERSYSSLSKLGHRMLENKGFEIEYLSIADANTGIELNVHLPDRGVIISGAIKFSNCRLIDNILIQ